LDKNRKDRVEKEKKIPLDVDGGVKVLSEETGSDNNFQNDRMGSESIYYLVEQGFVRKTS
jgi:hypothetical protein